MKTITFTNTVNIADVDGKSIDVGSVLKSLTDEDRGVVMEVVETEPFSTRIGPVRRGDLMIETGQNTTRVTNQYSKWKHIPHDEQTYSERFLSWMVRPYHHDEYSGVSKYTGLAIDGIMNLLPDDIVDWDHGPFPDTLEDALKFLLQHLNKMAKQ